MLTAACCTVIRFQAICPLQVLKENNAGGCAVTEPTLFYMPHCDCHLYNNLLKANWSPQQLCKIAILGNLLGELEIPILP